MCSCCSTVSGRAQLLWLCWTKPRTSSSERDCWRDLCSVHTGSPRANYRYGKFEQRCFSLSADSRFVLSGWRLRSVWHLHHPTVHTSELVWNLLQVRWVQCSSRQWRRENASVRSVRLCRQICRSTVSNAQMTFALQADPERLCWHGEHASTVFRAERGESQIFCSNKHIYHFNLNILV